MAAKIPEELRYCRSCYDHLAGTIGVSITEAMERNCWIKKKNGRYEVTSKGWEALKQIGISEEDFKKNKRPLTRQCLDWTERRPHLAGGLGASLLKSMEKRKWLKRKDNSRVWVFSKNGSEELYNLFGVMVR